jgi:hypothetical protein
LYLVTRCRGRKQENLTNSMQLARLESRLLRVISKERCIQVDGRGFEIVSISQCKNPPPASLMTLKKTGREKYETDMTHLDTLLCTRWVDLL